MNPKPAIRSSLAGAACGLALALGACAPATPPTNPAYPALEIMPTADFQPDPVEPTLTAPPPTRQIMGTPVREPTIHIQARAHLAGALTTAAENIIIVDSQAVDWPDSCMGVYAPDTACLDVITPGYIITAHVAAQTYTLHTNADGSVFKFAVPNPPASIIETARQALSAQFNRPATTFVLIASEAVTWPDGCLGVRDPNTECTQMLVPGYRLTFAADGQTYTLHTNADGSLIKILP